MLPCANFAASRFCCRLIRRYPRRGQIRDLASSCVSRGANMSKFIPTQVFLHHGVQEGQQFPHARRQHNFWFLTCFSQSLGEHTNHGIQSDGGRSSPLPATTDIVTSSQNHPLAFEAATVTVQRRYADQSCDLLAI